MSKAESVNGYTRNLLDKAEANGWTVVQFELRSPGWIVLEDDIGCTVRIESPYGLNVPQYVEQFVARPREPHIEPIA